MLKNKANLIKDTKITYLVSRETPLEAKNTSLMRNILILRAYKLLTR